MIIFACGLSKSGKTSLIRSARLERYGIRHVVASEFLQTLGQKITSLTPQDIARNQAVLTEGLLALLARSGGTIVLDGHLIIESGNTTQIIPIEALDALPLLGVIQIHALPSAIVRRRINSLTAKPVAELIRLIKLEAKQSSKLALRHHVKRYQLESRDSAGLTRIVNSLMST
ncbi:hypothetical protein [Methylocystis sp. Sn-Cys]|uniref:hypothetical protein n=1 Tax=Methylocystis sp. Sn-Cys TaxID=1701263 RepID=UPI001A5F8100|nr:hypothetical protein [Methylocystis sp. Sn-Cys]MBL1258624.1 hypothetical protein [Methylocystis sp. Sn-Cys]